MYYSNYNQKIDFGDIKLLTLEQREIGNKVLKPFGYHSFTGSIQDGDILNCDFNSGTSVSMGPELGRKLAKAFGVKHVIRAGTVLY